MALKVAHGIRVLKEPQSRRELTTREKIIILESSKLYGVVFLPWSVIPTAAEFAASSPYIDDTYFKMSPAQLEALGGWRSSIELSREALEKIDARNPRRDSFYPTNSSLDLVQDVTTDCSVVASLCAITSRTERGFPDLISRIFHPWNEDVDKPGISGNGKYVLRYHFNGSYRRVMVDDRLPDSKTERKLHVIDRNNATVLWPALVEKAYLKIRGGYDFPGSNSGTDLWVLTGWTPEQIFLQSDDLDRHGLWTRIFRAFTFGDVLVTIGTGKLTKKEERALGLIGEHDYAIIDMKEHRGQTILLVKNPWSKGTIWKGRVNYGGDIADKLAPSGLEGDTAIGGPDDASLSPGTFWIGFDHIFQGFESMYLNWNPGLFSHRDELHFTWDLAEATSPELCFRANPQYSISSAQGGPVWLLLSRHFFSRASTPTSSQNKDLFADSEPGFISLYAFNNGGNKVISGKASIAKSQYVDSPNTLLKLDMAPKTQLTLVVSQQALARHRHAFSISALSSTPIILASAVNQYVYNSTQKGRWTNTTAGGRAGSSTYYRNPQYSIEVPTMSNISLVLETSSDSVPINVKMVWAAGKLARSVTTRDVIGDSGEYTQSFALAKIDDLLMGTYTIICSTFEAGHTGDFSLHVSSTSDTSVMRIPLRGAGRYMSDTKTAAFTPHTDIIILPLLTRRINRFSVTARSSDGESSSIKTAKSPLKVACEIGRGPSAQLIAGSRDDDFSDATVTGAYIEDVSIHPSMCAGAGLFVVVERLAISGLESDEPIDLEISSDEPVELGEWTSTNR